MHFGKGWTNSKHVFTHNREVPDSNQLKVSSLAIPASAVELSQPYNNHNQLLTQLTEAIQQTLGMHNNKINNKMRAFYWKRIVKWSLPPSSSLEPVKREKEASLSSFSSGWGIEEFHGSESNRSSSASWGFTVRFFLLDFFIEASAMDE